MNCHFCKEELKEDEKSFIEVIVNDAPIYSCGSSVVGLIHLCNLCMYDFQKAGEEYTPSEEPLFEVEDLFKREVGQHLNVNVVDKETLIEAMEYPDRYPQLTIRVQYNAVHLNRLNKEQQEDVVNRTLHESV